MAKRLQYRRLLGLALLLLAGFGGLGYRLVDLQVLRHDELAALAQENTQREFLLEPRRGDILDTAGNLLATSVYVKTVCADPSLLGNYQPQIAHVLAPLLQMNEAELYQLLLPRTRINDKGETVTNQFVRLKGHVSDETWQTIDAAMSHLSFGLDEKKLSRSRRLFFYALRHSAIFARADQMRVYPNQTLAAHVLGFAQSEEREVNGMPLSQIVGRDGIELTLNSKLSGVSGWRLTETDRRGRELVPLREQDVEAVRRLERRADHRSSHPTHRRVRPGRCHAATSPPQRLRGGRPSPAPAKSWLMATLPNFDPNNPGLATPDQRRNRVVTDVMEPGSTFKIVVVSGALNDQVVRLGDIFNCEHGIFPFGGRTLHDHEPFDLLSVENIIAKSSNIGAAKIGIRMGEDRLHDYIMRFGFGERTGVTLPGEVKGIVHPVKNWSKVSVAQIPMGQGVAVTRLQMVMAMCTIANGGKLMRPMLVDRLEDENGNIVARYSPQVVRQVISEPTARLMVHALKKVVSPEGTAPKAALDHYTVAGKTGTAQKVEHGAYVHNKFVASFIGFFPADNPQLCISVVLDEPKEGYYGGSVAGPVFKQIAERAASYLNIRPDIGPSAIPESVAQADNPSSSTTLRSQ